MVMFIERDLRGSVKSEPVFKQIRASQQQLHVVQSIETIIVLDVLWRQQSV